MIATTAKTVLVDNMKSILIKILMSLVAIIAPLQSSILAMGFLIMADLVLGILASRKKGIPFSSKRLKDTGIKMLVYNTLLISGFVAQTYMVNWLPFVKIVLTFLAIVEITSLSESFQAITGLPFIKFIKDQIDHHLNKGKDIK